MGWSFGESLPKKSVISVYLQQSEANTSWSPFMGPVFQSTITSVTASKAIRVWIQNLRTNWLWFHFIWLYCVGINIVKMNINWKIFFSRIMFSNLIHVTCQNLAKYLNRICGDKTMVLTMLSLWELNMMLCKFSFWLPNVFETVAEAMVDWLEWKFQTLYKKY